QIIPSNQRPPQFASLPPLFHRNAGDPLPPLRDNVPAAPFAETIVKPLRIIEDIDPDPDVTDSVSVIDTLYNSVGGSALGMPSGFYYHGTETPSVLSLGFDLWMGRRDAIIQTIDFFLQDLGGLSRAPLPRDLTPAPRARHPAGTANSTASRPPPARR